MMFTPAHPGEALRDYLGEMSVAEAAERLCVTRAQTLVNQRWGFLLGQNGDFATGADSGKRLRIAVPREEENTSIDAGLGNQSHAQTESGTASSCTESDEVFQHQINVMPLAGSYDRQAHSGSRRLRFESCP